jgi:hypothetical protein
MRKEKQNWQEIIYDIMLGEGLTEIKIAKNGITFNRLEFKPISHSTPNKNIEGWEEEKYGIWKIISEMLDNPDEVGIYHTTKCYQEIDKVIDNLLSAQREQICKEIEGIPSKCLVFVGILFLVIHLILDY